jgi:hypothetical protein
MSSRSNQPGVACRAALAAAALAVGLLAAPATAQEGPSHVSFMGRGQIRGEVRLDHNNPLIGALALAMRHEEPHLLVVTSTDQHGMYRLRQLPDGRYWMAILRSGFEPVVEDGISVRGPFPAVMDHTAVPSENLVDIPSVNIPGEAGEPADVSLVILTPEGEPVEEARVRARRRDAFLNPYVGKTGSEGRLEFDDVPPGVYALTIQAMGRLRVDVESLVFSAGSPLEIRAVLLEQPLGYRPSPLELLPEETALVPYEAGAPLPRPEVEEPEATGSDAEATEGPAAGAEAASATGATGP